MKSLSFAPIVALLLFAACNSDKKKTVENTSTYSDSGLVNEEKKITPPPVTGAPVINELVSGYLAIKNSLVNSNATEAAAGAKALTAALEKTDASSFGQDQEKKVDEIKVDMKEHAKHIEDKSSDLAHQREHFDMLSLDMIDLIKITGSGTTLYHDFCPMYNDNKGASWLSETKEIKNPYYGDKMMKCGVVKEEFQPK